MDTTATLKPPATIRWSVGLLLPFAGALLIRALLSPSHPAGSSAALSGAFIPTLCLLLIALAVSAWVLYPPAGSALISAVIFACLLWAWAARQASWMAVAAFGALLACAVAQRQVRFRRALRMQQILDDLSEEQTMKDQATAIATQTRNALHKKLSRYTQLQTIAEELSGMTDLAAIARFAVDCAFRLIGKSDACLLFLVDQEQQMLSLFASKKGEAIAPIRTKHGDQFDRYVLRSHAPLLVNDVRRDFRFTVTVSPVREISAVIACPLLLGQGPAGVLRLDSAHAGAYTQDDLRFLGILLDLAETAVTNAKLFAQTQQLAMTDGLTGLTLRRPFLEAVTRELTRSGRSREPVSVLMLDVDHFKPYNDTFGHTAGDLVLKEVAGVLQAAIPPGAVAARYGGEEFVVLLPRFGPSDAREIAERMRQMVGQHAQGSSRGSRQTVTVSLGVATFPGDAQGELELIRTADQRLYQAKREGRNRVCAS